jgi:hypothetical protein
MGMGYLTVSLHTTNGCWVFKRVDRLVAKAFLQEQGGPGSEKRKVKHLDGNQSNCRADNLEWEDYSPEEERHSGAVEANECY